MMGRGAFGCQRLLARAETRLIADKLSADSYYGIVVISKLTRKTAIADAEDKLFNLDTLLFCRDVLRDRLEAERGHTTMREPPLGGARHEQNEIR